MKPASLIPLERIQQVIFDELERKVIGHDAAIRSLFDAIRRLMAPLEKPKREIGFHVLPTQRPAKSRRKS